MSMLTLRLGIERILMEKVEGITEVISIKPDDFDFSLFGANGDDDDSAES
jgi:hypothetical protein